MKKYQITEGQEPLWVARVWVDAEGLKHTEVYDFKTGEYSEGGHPISNEVENDIELKNLPKSSNPSNKNYR